MFLVVVRLQEIARQGFSRRFVMEWGEWQMAVAQVVQRFTCLERGLKK